MHKKCLCNYISFIKLNYMYVIDSANCGVVTMPQTFFAIFKIVC